MNIIKNPVYYGAIANGKHKVISFKNHNVVRKDFDEWIIVENTHNPLISKELWLEAQRTRTRNTSQTVRRSSDGAVSIFAGIIKCADCGSNLVFNRKVLKSRTKEFFRCSTYTQKGKAVCPMHNIDYNTLYQAVLANVQECAVLAASDERKLIEDILKANDEFKNKNMQRYEKNMREAENRIKEIDRILQNLYEDKISEEITLDLFKRMSQKYTDEQNTLTTDIKQLEVELNEYKCAEQKLSDGIKRIKACLTINKLTRDIVVALIERIEVSEAYDRNGEKTLDINIFYRFGLRNPTIKQQKNRVV